MRVSLTFADVCWFVIALVLVIALIWGWDLRG